MQDAFSRVDLEGVTEEIDCERYADGEWVKDSVNVPSEKELVVHVNHQELVTILCTPIKLNYLVLGFLYGEGIISAVGDVLMMRVCKEDPVADVRLKHSEFQVPTQRTITPGCGGGTMFKTEGQKVDSDLTVTPSEIFELMKQFQENTELSKLSGGVHASALTDNEAPLVIAEDIGRHNTLDRIQGECLMRGIPTGDRLLLTTGRISSEMLLKAAKLGSPVIVSRHSPTEVAVSLARELGITLIGHARGKRLLVYSHQERIERSTRDYG